MAKWVEFIRYKDRGSIIVNVDNVLMAVPTLWATRLIFGNGDQLKVSATVDQCYAGLQLGDTMIPSREQRDADSKREEDRYRRKEAQDKREAKIDAKEHVENNRPPYARRPHFEKD